MGAALVTTTLGDLPETDLDIKMIDQHDPNPQMWVTARECRYKGSDPKFAKHVGEIVRRDVWATIKRGHEMAGEQAKV